MTVMHKLMVSCLALWVALGVAAAEGATTIWAPATVPTVADSGPDSPVELGVRFRSDSTGYVTGVRFYKGSGNTGTHVGNLWSGSGTLLATAQFQDETASGWQQVNFPAPVLIGKDTVYVASYHTNVGHYSFNYGYFSGSGTDAPPLHAFADTAGGNGVYAYGSSSLFPSRSYHGSNYWVDLVFAPAPSDTKPPEVTSFAIPATSSSLIIPVTAFTATDDTGVVGYLVTESGAVPAPDSGGWSLTPVTSYTFTTLGTKTLYAWCKDAAGNVSQSRSASVTLSDQGGSPILVLTSATNPFSSYYAEILRAEGLNEFRVLDIGSLTDGGLSTYDIVILAEMPLTSAQVTTLSNWVDGGGKLIAMRPDPKLAPLLGLVPGGAGLTDRYLQIDTTTLPGAGISGTTLQYHGMADSYRLSGATSVATLYSDAATPTANPAVTLRTVGANGGKAAAFTFDLARSVVYTRQGNPAWAGQERDGYLPIRSDDLFYGPAAADPQLDWVDSERITIPQADELQRLLANLIIFVNQERKAIPRFWYLPRTLPAAVVMTGDDHGYGGTVGRFSQLNQLSPQGCQIDNWECLRATSYIYINTPISDAQAKAFQDAGFEIATHVTTNCADWTPATLRSFVAEQLSAWGAKFPSLNRPVTNRTHCVAWSDYASEPAAEKEQGIRLDTNFYHLSSQWVDHPVGFFTGSGMPMRFADAGGNLIDVYQAATQMTDESKQPYPMTIDTALDRALGPEGYYGFFTVNAHTDATSSEVSDAVVRSALARRIPVISAAQLLRWLDGRNASLFTGVSGTADLLSFSIAAADGARGLTAMIPVAKGRTVTAISGPSGSVPFSLMKLKGVQYAEFSAATGSYLAHFGDDTVSPVVTAVSPSSSATGTATIPVVQATFTKALDPITVTDRSFELRDPANLPVPATVTWDAATKTATLIPKTQLTTQTTYIAVIKGGGVGVTDLAGNPLAAEYTWSFTTAATAPQSYSLFGATVPGKVDSGPDNAVELGLKFRSDTSGTIKAIRFYKAAPNVGPHVGHLWDSSGTLLATATFTNESAAGWQQGALDQPVPIKANQTYVVSYHAPAGHYSVGDPSFSQQGVDNVPLHALATGISGPNGCYAYGPAGNFPKQGWRASNYWVDVVFVPSQSDAGSVSQLKKVSPIIKPVVHEPLVPLRQEKRRTAENLTAGGVVPMR